MAISEKKVKSELIWYYCQAHADIGICSSYGTMIASAFGFAPNNSTNYTEDKFVAIASKPNNPVAKLRKVQRTLDSLPKNIKRVIDAIYGNYLYPPQLTSIFGYKTGAALFNQEIIELSPLIKLCNKKLAKRTLSLEEVKQLQTIQTQTDALYAYVHKMYHQERNKHD